MQGNGQAAQAYPRRTTEIMDLCRSWKIGGAKICTQFIFQSLHDSEAMRDKIFQKIS